MKQLEQARLLLAKAREDEHAVFVLLRDADVGAAIVGFHCQQAAEKLLKALLSAHGAFYRHRHNLAELVEQLEQSGHPLPDDLRAVEQLTPFAVEFRYDLFEEPPAFDAQSALTLIRHLREHVEQIAENNPAPKNAP